MKTTIAILLIAGSTAMAQTFQFTNAGPMYRFEQYVTNTPGPGYTNWLTNSIDLGSMTITNSNRRSCTNIVVTPHGADVEVKFQFDHSDDAVLRMPTNVWNKVKGKSND